MESYRVITLPNSWKRAGQGELPSGFRYQRGSQILELPWGAAVEAREGCEYPFEFNQAEQKFLVHTGFLKTHKTLFKPL